MPTSWDILYQKSARISYKGTFEEELKRLLKEFGIEYDEKYFP